MYRQARALRYGPSAPCGWSPPCYRLPTAGGTGISDRFMGSASFDGETGYASPGGGSPSSAARISDRMGPALSARKAEGLLRGRTADTAERPGGHRLHPLVALPAEGLRQMRNIRFIQRVPITRGRIHLPPPQVRVGNVEHVRPDLSVNQALSMPRSFSSRKSSTIAAAFSFILSSRASQGGVARATLWQRSHP